MDFDGKRHSCLCLGKLPIQWQHHHSNVQSILDSCIVLLPHLLHCSVICYADPWQRMQVMKIGRIIMAMEMATDQGSTDTLWMGSHTQGTIRFIKINQSWITTKQIHFFHPIALIVFSYLDYRKRFKKTKLFQYFQRLGRSSSPNMVRLLEFSMKILRISHNIFSGTQRIFLFLDRGTKKPTGDATVTYESPESAKNAIERFDQMNFNGHGIISVKQALPDQKNPFAEKLVSFSRDPR